MGVSHHYLPFLLVAQMTTDYLLTRHLDPWLAYPYPPLPIPSLPLAGLSLSTSCLWRPSVGAPPYASAYPAAQASGLATSSGLSNV